MKNYVIIHALGRTGHDYWYPWLKKEIENKGYICFVPTMPGLENMSYATWEKEFEKIVSYINNESVVIGHSTGSIFLAHYLIKHKLSVRKFIGVVSFNEPNFDESREDWDKINKTFFIPNLEDLKSFAKERICFYSPTDIYDFNKLNKFAEQVSAQKVIIQNGGHFTAASGYGEKFPEILKYI